MRFSISIFVARFVESSRAICSCLVVLGLRPSAQVCDYPIRRLLMAALGNLSQGRPARSPSGAPIERGQALAVRSFVGSSVFLGQPLNLRVASVAWGSSDGRGCCGRAWTIDNTVGVACEGYEGDVDPRRAFPDNRPHSKPALGGFIELASHKTQQQGTEGSGGEAGT